MALRRRARRRGRRPEPRRRAPAHRHGRLGRRRPRRPAAGAGLAPRRGAAARPARRASSSRRGAAAPEDVVVLLRAVGALPVFERALQDVGLPTLAVGGRGYWGRQVVRDLCAWLAPRQPARRDRALRRARLAAGRGVDRRAWRSWGRPARPAGRTRGRRSPRRSSRRGHGRCPPARRRRPRAPRARSPRASRPSARVAPRLGLDELHRADRRAPPTTTCTCSRCPTASGAWPTCTSSSGSPRDHERERRPRRPGVRRPRERRAGGGGARARRARRARRPRRGAPHDDPRGEGPGVRRRVRRRPRAPRPRATRDDLLVAGDRVGLRARRARRLQRAGARYPRAARARRGGGVGRGGADRLCRADARARTASSSAGRSRVAKWPDATAQTAPPIAWLAPALVPGIDAGVPEEPVREVAWTTPGGEELRVRATVSMPGRGRHGAAPRPRPPARAEDLPVTQPAGARRPGRAGLTAPAPPPSSPTARCARWKECGYRFYLERVLGLPREPAPPPPPDAELPVPPAASTS